MHIRLWIPSMPSLVSGHNNLMHKQDMDPQQRLVLEVVYEALESGTS